MRAIFSVVYIYITNYWLFQKKINFWKVNFAYCKLNIIYRTRYTEMYTLELQNLRLLRTIEFLISQTNFLVTEIFIDKVTV